MSIDPDQPIENIIRGAPTGGHCIVSNGRSYAKYAHDCTLIEEGKITLDGEFVPDPKVEDK